MKKKCFFMYYLLPKNRLSNIKGDKFFPDIKNIRNTFIHLTPNAMSTFLQRIRNGYSGIFGNQVKLKNRKGKAVMDMPQKRKRRKPTEGQLAYRRRFQLASRQATEMLKDPETWAAYKKRARHGLTPYNVALKDILKPRFV
jgi:hypothetical protein